MQAYRFDGGDLAFAILFLFLMFWVVDGFERVDCALKIDKACEFIQAKYVKPQVKP